MCLRHKSVLAPFVFDSRSLTKCAFGTRVFGELAERLNAAVSKTVVVVRRPEVQILHSPPVISNGDLSPVVGCLRQYLPLYFL